MSLIFLSLHLVASMFPAQERATLQGGFVGQVQDDGEPERP